MMPGKGKGVLVLVVGPSGAGKDTLLDGARAALAGDTRFRFVKRTITRPADAGGEAHEAVDRAEFARRRAAGGFALHWSAHGLDYGIPADIAADLAAGRVVVANVSRAVLDAARARFPARVVVVTAPVEMRAARLLARGREDAAAIAERLAREVAEPEGTDVTVVRNDARVAEGVARFVAVLKRIASAASA
jgi:phosphonate metabolism protein PhnN/1,5-bisphosphokinase (PRPP-forming)